MRDITDWNTSPEQLGKNAFSIGRYVPSYKRLKTFIKSKYDIIESHVLHLFVFFCVYYNVLFSVMKMGLPKYIYI